MVLGDVFVALVIGLQVAASIGYLIHGDWRQMLVWLGVAVSNAAWLSVTRG